MSNRVLDQIADRNAQSLIADRHRGLLIQTCRSQLYPTGTRGCVQVRSDTGHHHRSVRCAYVRAVSLLPCQQQKLLDQTVHTIHRLRYAPERALTHLWISAAPSDIRMGRKSRKRRA
jgi:hypothetical protein